MVNQDKVRQAIKLLLEGIGEDTEREGLAETPDRIARMYTEILSGMTEEPSEPLSRVFTVENSEMVLEKDIVFHSMCEHHMLPFYGKVHVAYLPDGKVVGLSKLARTVAVCSPEAAGDCRGAAGYDESDCRCHHGASCAQGCDDRCGGRTYVYDHEGREEAGK